MSGGTDGHCSQLWVWFVPRQRRGMFMSRFKPSVHRRGIVQRFPVAPHRERMLSDRAYVELGRQTRLRDVPKRRPPYLEALATAVAFAFLAYLVLGGA
jgi:hypothetical protein